MALQENELGQLMRSPEALGDYLTSVRKRIASQRILIRREFWQQAQARLAVDLQAAQDVQAEEIASELTAVLQRFVDALASPDNESDLSAEANLLAEAEDAAAHAASSAHLAELELAAAEKERLALSRAEAEEREQLVAAEVQRLEAERLAEEERQREEHFAAEERQRRASEEEQRLEAERLALEAIRLAAEAEQQAAEAQQRLEAARAAAEETAASLVEFSQSLSKVLEDFAADSGEGLVRDFQCRALFCGLEARRMEARGIASLFPDLTMPVQHLSTLAQTLDAAVPVQDRQEFPFCLDVSGRGEITSLSTEVWTELNLAYSLCIDACHAANWYAVHREDLDRAERTDLLNTIAASQQFAFRAKDRFSGRDRSIIEFYKMLMDLKDLDSVDFLTALNKKSPQSLLLELAEACQTVWSEIRTRLEEDIARAERERIQKAAISAVVAWEDNLEGRSVTRSSREADKQILCKLLDACLEAKVAPSNVEIRAAILDVAPVLLEGEKKYAKFLEAVLNERQRRKLDVVEVDDEAAEEPDADEDFELMRKTVADYLRGKNVLILGGSTKVGTRDQLSLALECTVNWPDTRPGDRGGKHDGHIKRADVVLFVKSFARHDLHHRSREITRNNGSQMIKLPAGYGVRQVVNQVYTTITRERVNGKSVE